MIEIRIHGRGGQGAVTSAEILATAAFFDVKASQAFPSFGTERMGEPVQAFCRIDEKPIRIHQNVYEPDHVIVLDETLLNAINVFEGLKKKGVVFIASKRPASEFKSPAGQKIYTVDAYSIARELIGRPIVNTAMLGAFSKITRLVSLESLKKAVEERFSKDLAEKNNAAVEKCFNSVNV
ncbi:pyruvate ferredoxin oxidoreductase subunit gamma [Candidatus Micrarchaeota archaeon]|nr:pyruvate ferredoxin oxidoreductase subunit gamma [Candidatus Micrarchaeota archaeon]